MRPFLSGWLLALAAAAGAAGPRPSAGGGSHRFILLLYEGRSFDAAVSHVDEYRSWSADLRAEGREVSGDEILPGGDSLSSGGASGLESPAGGDERLAGYFVVSAASLSDALAVGRRCPHLRHGGRVVVRALGG